MSMRLVLRTRPKILDAKIGVWFALTAASHKGGAYSANVTRHLFVQPFSVQRRLRTQNQYFGLRSRTSAPHLFAVVLVKRGRGAVSTKLRALKEYVNKRAGNKGRPLIPHAGPHCDGALGHLDAMMRHVSTIAWQTRRRPLSVMPVARSGRESADRRLGPAARVARCDTTVLLRALARMTSTLASAAKWSRVVTSGFVGCFLLAVSSSAQNASSTSVAEAQRVVSQAARHGTAWTGPQEGPSALSGKSIAFIAEDLRNGGILGVAQGVREAAKVLGWTVRLFDAGGTAPGRAKALESALASAPDGVVLSGVDALENTRSLARFAERRIPVVGWHVGPAYGPIAQAGVAENVMTDPRQVARVTAMAAIAQSNGRAGVVIFTDSRYGIATAKAETMAAVIRACEKCTLLEIQDVPMSEIEARIPVVTRELLQRYGMKWTHALAINDIVFDYAVPALTQARVKSDRLSLLSAGDGSASAFLRIQAGTFQTATVAEPLNLQGWQVMDELNRQFAHAASSGFVAPVHLVTAENLAYDGGSRLQYDPEHGYRSAYRRIWGR